MEIRVYSFHFYRPIKIINRNITHEIQKITLWNDNKNVLKKIRIREFIQSF